jgi:hypothetical protein
MLFFKTLQRNIYNKVMTTAGYNNFPPLYPSHSKFPCMQHKPTGHSPYYAHGQKLSFKEKIFHRIFPSMASLMHSPQTSAHTNAPAYSMEQYQQQQYQVYQQAYMQGQQAMYGQYAQQIQQLQQSIQQLQNALQLQQRQQNT